MHNTLVQLLRVQSLSQRLHHVVHKVYDQLTLVRDPLVFLGRALQFLPPLRQRHQHHKCTHAESDQEKENHGKLKVTTARLPGNRRVARL